MPLSSRAPLALAPLHAPLSLGEFSLSPEDIITYARQFDWQDFHLDAEAARRSLLGGLAASGWQTCSLQHRLLAPWLAEHGLDEHAFSCPFIRWLAPVRPDTPYRLSLIAIEPTEEPALLCELAGPDGPVMQTRFAFATTSPAARPMPPIAATSPALAFEDLEIGITQPLGPYTFTAPAIAAYHDAFSGKASAQANPWHIGAGWMQRMLTSRDAQIRHARAQGDFVPVFGPASGLQDLLWLGAVEAGETLTYTSTLIAKRLSTRPGWANFTALNQGFDQHGRERLRFSATVFMGTRALKS